MTVCCEVFARSGGRLHTESCSGKTQLECDLVIRGIRFHPIASSPADVRPALPPTVAQLEEALHRADGETGDLDRRHYSQYATKLQEHLRAVIQDGRANLLGRPAAPVSEPPSQEAMARCLAEVYGNTWHLMTADKRDYWDMAGKVLDRFWPARND